MNMPPLRVRLPSVAQDIAAGIDACEHELARLLKMYSDFEAAWNRQFKAIAAGEGRRGGLAALSEERAACEAGLGIEALVDRIRHLRDARNALCEMVGMAAAGASPDEIAARAEHFFGGRAGNAGPLGLEAWWLAGSLLDWVDQPVVGSETDIIIGITWRDCERLAACRLSGEARG